MNKFLLNTLLSVNLLAISVANVYADTTPVEKPVVEKIVDTLTTLSGGPHAGYRANHAKGIVVDGEFIAAPTAAEPLMNLSAIHEVAAAGFLSTLT